MAGQRTRIRFGSVSAEVLLEKTSTKPRAAQHETRRVLADPELKASPDPAALMRAEAETMGGVRERIDHGPPSFETELRGPATDPFGDPVDVSGSLEPVDSEPMLEPVDDADRREVADMLGLEGTGRLEGTVTFDSAEHEPQRQPVAAPDPESIPSGVPRRTLGVTSQEYVPPATRVEQGVHLEDGTWVDLTAQLQEVDDRTRVDGLEVARTIPGGSYASERVREAHYVCGVDPDTFKVLSLLWRALRQASMAAEVRWTKRTAQATGILVARGALPTARAPRPAVPAHLLLLELEWHAQIKRVPPRARGPVMADVALDELVAATELVQSFAAPAPRDELRDERLAKRAELLELARAGKLAEYEPPAEPMPDDLVDGLDVELAEAMALAALWNREHAPA